MRQGQCHTRVWTTHTGLLGSIYQKRQRININNEPTSLTFVRQITSKQYRSKEYLLYCIWLLGHPLYIIHFTSYNSTFSSIFQKKTSSPNQCQDHIQYGQLLLPSFRKYIFRCKYVKIALTGILFVQFGPHFYTCYGKRDAQ